jgi:hypothetical protein
MKELTLGKTRKQHRNVLKRSQIALWRIKRQHFISPEQGSFRVKSTDWEFTLGRIIR